jgi:hypothetical protein
VFKIQLDAEMQSCTASRSKDTFRFNGVISTKRHLVIVPNRKNVPIMLDLSEQNPPVEKKEFRREAGFTGEQIKLNFDLMPADDEGSYARESGKPNRRT